jgi:hypothetical protein
MSNITSLPEDVLIMIFKFTNVKHDKCIYHEYCNDCIDIRRSIRLGSSCRYFRNIHLNIMTELCRYISIDQISLIPSTYPLKSISIATDYTRKYNEDYNEDENDVDAEYNELNYYNEDDIKQIDCEIFLKWPSLKCIIIGHDVNFGKINIVNMIILTRLSSLTQLCIQYASIDHILVTDNNKNVKMSILPIIPNLKILEFKRCNLSPKGNKTNFEALNSYRNLTHLSIKGDNFRSLEFLVDMTNLEYLSLGGSCRYVRAPGAFDVIGTCVNIRKLDMSSNLSCIGTTKFIYGLTKLKSLNLYDSYGMNIEDLNNNTTLTSLDISHGRHVNIPHIPNLEKLYASCNSNITYLPPLNINLRKLDIACTTITDISNIRNLTNLECLNILGTNIPNICHIYNCVKLTQLVSNIPMIYTMEGTRRIYNMQMYNDIRKHCKLLPELICTCDDTSICEIHDTFPMYFD